MAEALYLNDSYLKGFDAKVVSVKDGKFIVLDKTAFYPSSGGQAHDTGKMICNGVEYKVVFTGKFDDISHEVDKEGLKEGDEVRCVVDWDRRYKLMRMHTAAHVISGIFHNEEGVLITGNQLDVEKSRIDFSFENFDREKMNKYFERANELIDKDLKVNTFYMNIEEVKKDPSLIKLAAGFKHDIKNIRIVEIETLDKQPDGGTHVKSLKEVGHVEIIKLDNKGKGRKRLYYKLVN